MIKSYKELIVWQKSMDLAVLVYKLTEDFPKNEIFGLVIQMRRAAVSIPSNIAEGWTRHSTKEYVQFLSIAAGSAGELETQLILSDKLDYVNETLYNQTMDLLVEVQKMIPSVIKGLAANP